MKKILFSGLLLALTQFQSKGQIITNYAGTGTYGYSGDGGPATNANISTPIDVETDLNGNVYLADFQNNRIRKMDAATGIITTIAGNGNSGYTGDGMAATASALHDPYGVAVDKFGNVFIADQQNNRIRKVDASTGLISTVAGSGTGGFAGDGGLATAPGCKLNNPDKVAVDTAGNIYIIDQQRIRKVTASTGIISTVAGTGTYGYNGDGIPATSANLAQPMAITVNAAGDLFIADESNHRLRKVTASTGLISTLAGNGNGGYTGDGIAATTAQLNWPNGVALDASGNIFISDMNNNRIRKIDVSNGNIYTVAGTGVQGFGGNGGLADSAQLYQPYAVALDPCDNIFIADGGFHVRKVSKMTVDMHSSSAGCPGNNGGAAFVLMSGGVSPYTYLWSTGSTFFGSPNLFAGTYSVVVTDSRGCKEKASVTIYDRPAPASIPICMVTVDDSSKNNNIYWDKTGLTYVKSFNIYRDTANNNFAVIGNVPYAALSYFTDTARHIGAVNGDPNVTTYRYKISVVDSCGTESALSPYHNTVYTYNTGTQFIFNAYQIEGQPIPVPGLTGYILKRDNFNTGSYVTAGSGAASSTIINDPNYNTYQSTANWYVETQWTTACTPTLRQSNGTQTTIVKSKSNISNNRNFGIRDRSAGSISFSVYPNPGSGIFTVETQGSENYLLQVFDVRGKLVLDKKIQNGSYTVDLSGLSEGVYNMNLLGTKGIANKKLVIVR